jgi:hypothetical protein
VTRQASKAKLDYYRTQDPEVLALADLVDLPPQPMGTIRILDPCVGEGKALRLFADQLMLRAATRHPELMLYGIEVHQGRARQAAKAIGKQRVLVTSYLKAYVTPGSVQLLFCNPPYDEDTGAREGGKRVRLEITFLEQGTVHLGPDGILIWIVPQRMLLEAAEFLASYYYDLRCWRFSDEEWVPPEDAKKKKATPIYSQFKQVVVIGRRRAAPIPPQSRDIERILAWAEAGEALPILPRPRTAAPEEHYAVPLAPYKPMDFVARAFDAAAAAARVSAGNGVFAERWYNEEHWPEPTEAQAGVAKIVPLVPLRIGMLLWILVAGLFNGLVVPGPDGHPMLMKGVSRKQVHAATSRVMGDDGSSEVTHTFTDTFVASFWMRDLETGELILVGDEP